MSFLLMRCRPAHQGITIDTTQIRFRTGSRDIVLIDRAGPRRVSCAT